MARSDPPRALARRSTVDSKLKLPCLTNATMENRAIGEATIGTDRDQVGELTFCRSKDLAVGRCAVRMTGLDGFSR